MKHLRILTGRHAGAQLPLDRQRYVIGPQDDADISLTDWTEAPLALVLDKDGNVILEMLGKKGRTTAVGALEDGVARRFGDVVLCAGPADAAWPSDVTLMERLMRPPEADAAPTAGTKRKGRHLMAFGVTGAAALLCAFTTVVIHATSAAGTQANAVPPSVQLRRAVAAAKIYDATVSERGGQLIVEGLLPDEGEAMRLRQVVASAGLRDVLERYAAANDVSRSIGDALGEQDVKITYKGEGVFVIGGKVRDLEKTRQNATRIAGDLKPLVQRIEVIAEELPQPDRVPIGAMLASDDLQYVQTRDGAKHLTVRSPEPGETVLAD
jgi:type III secretion protein D